MHHGKIVMSNSEVTCQLKHPIFRGFLSVMSSHLINSTFNLLEHNHCFVPSVALCLSKVLFVVCTAAAFYLIKIIRIPSFYVILKA